MAGVTRPTTSGYARALSTLRWENAKHERHQKAVLAYSGGLDTSVILKWLQDTYKCEVVTFTADIGQARS